MKPAFVLDTTVGEVFEKTDPYVASENEPLVSIVTTAYKNVPFNEKYFDSVNNQTYKNIEVIFVDNCSPDETTEDAKPRLKRGKILRSLVDDGCAAGNNRGAKKATGKYIFLLGQDTWIDEKCVENLVKAASASENMIYTSKQMSYDGSVFFSCGIAGDLFGYPARAYASDNITQIRKLFYVDGTNIFMTLENYRRLGMMDEETFLFAEDVDLSWKGHLCGMDIVAVPNSIVYHWSGGALGVGGFPKENTRYETATWRRMLAERNIIRNIIKNYQWWNVLWVLPFYLLINVAEMVALILTGQLASIHKTYFAAYMWNIKNITNTLAKRKAIQNIRTVSDLEVMKKMSFLPHKFFALLELGIPKIK